MAVEPRLLQRDDPEIARRVATLLEAEKGVRSRFLADFRLVAQNVGVATVPRQLAALCAYWSPSCVALIVVSRSDAARCMARFEVSYKDARPPDDVVTMSHRTFHVPSELTRIAAHSGIPDGHPHIMPHKAHYITEYAGAHSKLVGTMLLITVTALPDLSDASAAAVAVPFPADGVTAVTPLDEHTGSAANLVTIEPSDAFNLHDFIAALLGSTVVLRPSCGTLQDHSSCAPPMHRVAVKFVVAQLLYGACFMQQHGVIFRDATPSSIVVTRLVHYGDIIIPIVRFLRFDGIATPRSAQIAIPSVPSTSTPCYRPPELARAVPGAADAGELRRYDGRVDSFSIGCILFVLMTGAMLTNKEEDAFPGRFERREGRMKISTGSRAAAPSEPQLAVVDAFLTHFPEGSEAYHFLQAATNPSPVRDTVPELLVHPWVRPAVDSLPDIMRRVYKDDAIAVGNMYKNTKDAAAALALGYKAIRAANENVLPLQPTGAAPAAGGHV